MHGSLFLVVALLALDPRLIRFQNFSREHGLSSRTINCMLQDRMGFLWIGTQDGLNRYDGRNFVHFRSQFRNPQSLPSNLVTCLLEDGNGYLWVGTQKGLARLNLNTGLIQRFSHDPENNDSLSSNGISSLAMTPDGRLWVGTYHHGLNRLDSDRGRFVRFRHEPRNPQSIGSDQIRELMVDRQGELWIGTYGAGVLKRKPDGSGFSSPLPHGNPLKNSSVRCLLEDQKGRVWIGLARGGLGVMEGGSIEVFEHDPADPGSIGRGWINRIFEDHKGRIWIGTRFGGLHLFQEKNAAFLSFGPGTRSELDGVFVRSLFQDRSGVLWIGTDKNGLFKLSPMAEFFRQYEPGAGLDNLSAGVSITCLYEDRENGIWMGTPSHGLRYANLQTGAEASYRDLAGVTDAVLAIQPDSGEGLWLGTSNRGVLHFNKTTGKAKRVQYANDPGFLQSGGVVELAADPWGGLLIGTYGKGLFRLDPNNKFISRVDGGDHRRPLRRFVQAILVDRQKRLWVGYQDHGLACYDRGRNKWWQFLRDDASSTALSSNYLTALAQEPTGRFWIGTEVGLLHGEWLEGEPGTLVFHRDHIEHAQLRGTVNAIGLDQRGAVWVSKKEGLFRFNPANQTVIRFGISDGLALGDFNHRAFFAGRGGAFYFGATKGIVAFDPEHLVINGTHPLLAFTSLNPLNQKLSSPSPFLPKSFEADYGNGTFSLGFAALDFWAPERNRFSFKLEGNSSAWVDLEEQRHVTFAGLKPGRYKLHLRAANSHNQWSEGDIEFPIVIHPPIWSSFWAKLGYFVLLVLLGAISVVVALRRLRRRQVLNEQNQKAELQRQKLEGLGRIAGGIAHDFNKFLASILGFNSLAMLELGKKHGAYSHLEDVEAAGKDAQAMIASISTFGRMAKPKFKMLSVRDVVLEGLKLAEIQVPSHVEVQRFLDTDVGTIMGDPTQINRMILNFCDNAVRASGNRPTKLKVSLNRLAPSKVNPSQGEQVVLTFADTGCGIPSHALPRIFDPFFTSDPQGKGSGLGLAVVHGIVSSMNGRIEVHSQPGEGTRFQVFLPAVSHPHINPIHDAFEPTHGGKGRRILWVDDDALFLKFAKHMATRMGYEVQTEADALQGLSILCREPAAFDLVITDLSMPGADGRQFAQAIVSLNPAPPIILCSGNPAALRDLEKDSRLFKQVLTKPVSAAVFSQKASLVLAMAEKEKARIGGPERHP